MHNSFFARQEDKRLVTQVVSIGDMKHLVFNLAEKAYEVFSGSNNDKKME